MQATINEILRTQVIVVDEARISHIAGKWSVMCNRDVPITRATVADQPSPYAQYCNGCVGEWIRERDEEQEALAHTLAHDPAAAHRAP